MPTDARILFGKREREQTKREGVSFLFSSNLFFHFLSSSVQLTIFNAAAAAQQSSPAVVFCRCSRSHGSPTSDTFLSTFFVHFSLKHLPSLYRYRYLLLPPPPPPLPSSSCELFKSAWQFVLLQMVGVINCRLNFFSSFCHGLPDQSVSLCLSPPTVSQCQQLIASLHYSLWISFHLKEFKFLDYHRFHRTLFVTIDLAFYVHFKSNFF